MTTNIDWGSVLLDTVKELAAQPGGEPWTTVAEGIVRLVEENTDLKAEIERLRGAIDEDCGFHRLAAENNQLRKSLQRVIGALQLAYRKHHMGDETIGWNELSSEVGDVLADVMGDKEF